MLSSLSVRKNGDGCISASPDQVIRYLPNADFQKWFMPVAKRTALGIALIPVGLLVLWKLNLLTPLMHIVVLYLRLFKFFLLDQGDWQTAVWINILTPLLQPIFSLLGLFIAYWSCRLAGQRDCLFIDDSGMTFGKIAHRNKTLVSITVHQTVKWKCIQAIEIKRPPNTRSNLDYIIDFKLEHRHSLKIRFGDIIDSDKRQFFISKVKQYCGQWLDEESVTVFDPPSDRQSYTELWLSELSAPPKRDRLTPLESGATLSNQKYQIIRRLGAGGQGIVYLAFSSSDKDEVVLKEFVLPVFPDKEVRKAAAVRFQEEANLLTKLDHPQIVKLKDLFLEDHRAYLVLEHLQGENLKDLVATKGPLPLAETFRLGQQMCLVLAYLHSRQPPVVHRDFTPDNLILDLDNRIKLIDFSVAQTFTSNVTGSVVGKPNYIAPEQFRGKPTTQSDIYAMGATLFYLVTAIEPEPITNLKLKEYKNSADDRLATIIEKCTKLDVTNRYQTAEEVLKQLP